MLSNKGLQKWRLPGVLGAEGGPAHVQHWLFSIEVVPKPPFMQQKAVPPAQRSFTRSKSLGSSLNAQVYLMPCAQQSQDCFAL